MRKWSRRIPACAAVVALVVVAAVAPLSAGQGDAAAAGKVSHVSVGPAGGFAFQLAGSATLSVDPACEDGALMKRLVVLAAEKGWTVRATVAPGTSTVASVAVDSSGPATPNGFPQPATVVPSAVAPPSFPEPLMPPAPAASPEDLEPLPSAPAPIAPTVAPTTYDT